MGGDQWLDRRQNWAKRDETGRNGAKQGETGRNGAERGETGRNGAKQGQMGLLFGCRNIFMRWKYHVLQARLSDKNWRKYGDFVDS